MTLHNPEATEAALSILRSGEPFQWYVVSLLALLLYAYINEISKKNWRVVAGGLALYMVHWSVEIANALIQHFSGHALWTVPTGTSFLILVGVGIEISLMFPVTCPGDVQAVAGRSASEDLGNQQPSPACLDQRGPRLVPRDLPCQDPGFRVGLPLVGSGDCLPYGLHTLLCGGLLCLRLETGGSEAVSGQPGGDKCRGARPVCGGAQVDLAG